MAPNPQVAKAFRAMKGIGIPEEKVKPVLKNLLKLYEKNWELIEAENYRVLADAIFETEEMEAAENRKKLENPDREEVSEEETQVHDEPDHPLKRSRLKHQNALASSSLTNYSPSLGETGFKKPKVEADELNETSAQHQPQETTACQGINSGIKWTESDSVPPQPLTRNKGKQPVSPKSLAVPERSFSSQPAAAHATHLDVRSRTESDSNSSSMHLRDKEKEPLLPQNALIDFRLISERSSQGVCIREPKVDSSISLLPKQVSDNRAFIKPKDGPFTDDVLQFEVPVPVVHPEPLPLGYSSNGTFRRDPHGQELVRSCSVDESDKSEVTLASPSKKRQTCELVTIPISSPPEEVKLSLSCNSALGRSENHCASDIVVARGMPVQPFYYVNDLDKGQERFAITLENKINNECPPSFHYIAQNVVFQSASVNFSLARIGDSCCSMCLGDCLLSSTPCACSHETGGEHAYTLEGLVKEKLLEEYISMNCNHQKNCQLYCKECPLERSKNEKMLEPCKGRLVRKFIKECWWKCGCSKQCGNRVVQRGINRKLQVFMTSGGKGWGLRTLEDLPKGAFVCEYVGEVLTNAELYDRVSQSPGNESPAYHVLLDADWGSEGVLNDEEALCLDATHYGNVARFINHRCFDPSLVEIPVQVETPDHHYYHLAFFTTRNVKALEELTWDYGINFEDHDHYVKAFQCKCGSKFCRNINSSSRSGSAATIG